MARSFEEEAKAIAAEEKKLADRRKALAERQQLHMAKLVEKSSLGKVAADRFEAFLSTLDKVGIDEAERRLAGT